MSQDIINNRFLEESVFAIADGYCVINLTKSIVRGSMYQVVNGKKYNLNEQLGLPENSSLQSGTGHLLDLLRNAGCGGGVTGLGALGGPLLALHLGLLGGEGTLGHGQNREVLARLGAVLDSSGDLLDVVGQLRQQDDVRAAGNAGVQRQPAGFVAHDLNAHDAAVAARGGVDAVNDLGGDVHSSVEAERHVGAVDVVVDGLGQTDDVQAFLREQVGGFMGAIAAQAAFLLMLFQKLPMGVFLFV